MLLQEFDYEIVYKPGSEHNNVDALSRICVIKSESLIPLEEFMNNNNVYINNNIQEINETINDIPDNYNILLTLTADLFLSFNVFREYIIQLGNLKNSILSTGSAEVKQVAVVNDNNRKYLYALTEYSCDQSPTYKTM